MDNLNLKAKVLSIVPNAEITENKQYLTVCVIPEKLHELAKQLKEDPETYFDYLFCLSGVDYGDSLGVVYHLESVKHRHSIVLKTKTPDRETPRIDSVYDLWRAAEYPEREVFDLFGIKFNNHPDLRRFFLDDSWGYPLRKDFVDEVNIIEK
ncbi:MAG: NADH-quinone oxidoreductase subunit C [Bacteroidota bacterium]